ncbi:aspartate ammonia-lyase [Candidatus Micrarchaeota archaeon]|nr:aspartate ammonia-lyase [Candidatus Micrarchaeota archaeon]
MREEEDFIGTVMVPEDAYYGSFTARAAENFRLSGLKVDAELIKSVAIIKKSAALANMELGMLEEKKARAIADAAREVIQGRHGREFILDAFQAGAGTPLHMNVNEVIANRAEELLGGKKGEYRLVHPNNDVNMSQSSNNVVPSAIKIAAIRLNPRLLEEAEALKQAFDAKSEEYHDAVKTGRTHLQDAVPMTYGQSFSAYAKAVEKDLAAISSSLENLQKLGVGGTATGTGITAHPEFRERITEHIKNEGLNVSASENPVESTQNMNSFLSFSCSLKRYAVTLNRIADDLRLLSSGPKAGIAELVLPGVEPGSSIMPGKLNPSIPEAVNMVCYQVMANEHAVLLACQSGQLELNFATPLIAHSILQSQRMLARCSAMFRELCIEGLKVNREKAKENFEKTFGYATAFNPYLGYTKVSKLVAEAYQKGTTLKSLIVGKGLLSEEETEKIIASAMGPSRIDEKIRKGLEQA